MYKFLEKYFSKNMASIITALFYALLIFLIFFKWSVEQTAFRYFNI